MSVRVDKNQNINDFFDKKSRSTQNPASGDFVGRMVGACSTFFRMLRDPRYHFPRQLKALGLITFLYVLLPIDLVPELLFGPLGIVDDFGLLLFFLRSAYQEILNYQQTRETTQEL